MSESDQHIVFKHFRCAKDGNILHYQREKSTWEPAPRGGFTKCFIYDADNHLIGYGTADCSRRDAFCYRIGRNISRGRALKNLAEEEWLEAKLMMDDLNPLLIGA